MPRRPEHLQRRDGIYHFRMRVPAELQPTLAKREFRLSLKTSDFSEAKRLVALQRLKAVAEIDAARRKLVVKEQTNASKTEQAFSDEDLWSLMTIWFIQQQKKDAVLSIADVRVSERLEDLAYTINPNDTNTSGFLRTTTTKFLTEQRVALAPDSNAFRRLSELILEAYIEREKRLIRRFSDVRLDLNPRFQNLNVSSTIQAPSALTLDQLIERYDADRALALSASKTQAKRAAQFRLLKEVLGAKTLISKIGRTEARSFFDTLSRMPSNATKRFPGVPICELLRRPPEALGQKLSPTTANAYMIAFTALMQFAVDEHLVDRNPAKGLQIASDGTKAKDKRLPFSDEDLTRIFSAPLFLGCQDDEFGYSMRGSNRPRRGRYWVPLIALFSGMRLNEICQLECDDIQVLVECDVILVRPSDDGTKKVKTAAAIRTVPIHPVLKSLGLLDYVEEVRQTASRACKLFPELKIASTGYASDNFSKWFARFLDHAGVTHDKKSFHSFRHNFRDALTAGNVPEERRRLLGGWSNKGTDAKYGGSLIVQAEALTEEIAKVRYPRLSLAHLMPTNDLAILS